MKAPDFLNVDLDIESKSSLRALAREFGDRVSVMFSGRRSGRHCLYLETASGEEDQDAVLNALCTLVEGLSASGRRAWDKAEKREFDLGYEARLTSGRGNRFSIHPDTLLRVAGLGASVAVTIYREDRRTRRVQRTPR